MKKNVLLRPPVLVVMVALLLAVSGVLYAHWTTSLNLDGQINTGGVGVAWFDAWTNDDGNDFGDPTDDGGPHDGKYDGWGGDSSADPSADGRYDKDVAACFAQADGSHLNVWIDGAYPSYNCMITALVGGENNVPVRATTLSMMAWKGFCGIFWPGTSDEYDGGYLNFDDGGPYSDENQNGEFDAGDIRLDETCVDGVEMEVRPGTYEGNFEFGMPGGDAEIEGDISAGIRCGTQVDPVACWWALPGGTPYEGPMVHFDGNEYVDVNENGEYDEAVDGPMLTHECDLGGTMVTSGWIHVLQPAAQNAGYSWNLTQNYVNWNEWDVSMCDPYSWVDPDGVPDSGDEYQLMP